MEYELSATRFDLRFIPEEMSFDQDPKETCDHPPRPEDYKPKVRIFIHLLDEKLFSFNFLVKQWKQLSVITLLPR
jgi:hypothetical protein